MLRALAVAVLLLATPAYADLSENKIVDSIEILLDGRIQVREATIIYRDGEEVGRENHRYVLDPAVDTADQISDERLRGVAELIWTEEVIDARRQARAAEAIRPLP